MDPVAYALMRSGLFSSLPQETFGAFVDCAERVAMDSGTVIVAEGEPSNCFYVLLAGACEVFVHDANGAEILLAGLGPGDHFGEQSLIAGTGVRAASVRAGSDVVEVVRLPVERLQALFAHAPRLQTQLRALGRRQLEERLSRATTLVRRLLVDADNRTHEIVLDNGDVLCRQGEPAQNVYVVLSGSVELLEDRDGVSARVASVGPGLCIGADDSTTHARTAVADGWARVLRVDRAAVAATADESPEARAHLRAVESVWALPQRGFVTQHLGAVDGSPCVTQVFRLADGRNLVSSHVVGSEHVRLQVDERTPARSVETPDGDVRVHLEPDGRIASIDAAARTNVLATLYERAIDGRPLTPAEVRSLEAKGEVADRGPEFVCACMRISHARIADEIADGAATLADLKQRTGCAMACGSCVPALQEALGETAFVEATIARREELCPDVIRLVFGPRATETFRPAQPGQHTVVRVSMDSAVAERPYTLSGAAGDAYEVTVERLPGGVVSEWLFDNAKVGSTVEVSHASGSYVWRGGPAPVVVFAAGIGVTPGLAFVRTLLQRGWPHRLVVDWSTRHPAHLQILGELGTYAGPPNLDIRPRITSRDGRLQQEDIAAYVRRFPTAEFFVCGGPEYMEFVVGTLRERGVGEERTHVEYFDPNAAAAPQG